VEKPSGNEAEKAGGRFLLNPVQGTMQLDLGTSVGRFNSLTKLLRFLIKKFRAYSKTAGVSIGRSSIIFAQIRSR
jgi:hypothetical protein